MMPWLEGAAPFAGAALCVSLVEHPARMACGVEVAAAGFAPSHRRAAAMQVGLATLAALVRTLARRTCGCWRS